MRLGVLATPDSQLQTSRYSGAGMVEDLAGGGVIQPACVCGWGLH